MPSSTRFSALVPRHDLGAVLTIFSVRQTDSDSRSFELPWAEADDHYDTGVLALAERFEIGSPFLRHSRESKEHGSLFEFDAPPASWVPGGSASWLPLDRTDEIAVPDEFREAFQNWLSEQRGAEISSLRAAWARPGWYDSITSWGRDHLARLGISPTGHAIPVKQWGISVVLRQPTTDGDFYLKAAYPGFAHEAALTADLATNMTDLVPPVAASDAGRAWLLMRDMKVTPMRESPADRWAEGLRALGRIQAFYSGRTDELLALGCPDRRLDVLSAQLPDVAFDPLVTANLTSAELDRVSELVPSFQRLCKELADGPVPASLLHGDFHTDNAGLRSDGSVCIFDWSDGAVGHPFLDVWRYIHKSPPEEQPVLVDAYVTEWSSLSGLPSDELHQLMPIADVLCCLHQVVSYQGILTNLEPSERWTLGRAGEWWWRQTLEAWERLSAE